MSHRTCTFRPDSLEAETTHLSSCRECAAEIQTLEQVERSLGSTDVEPLSPVLKERLPVAPWEGASHRAWLAPVAVGAMLMALAALVAAATGTNPLDMIAAMFRGAASSATEIPDVARSLGTLVSTAPLEFRAAVVAAFIVINGLFAVMLRRRPRGIRG
ncbi:MAG: hypothetical protein KY459_00785 [Acidobacteria bacterium]|nr:hypothetical protein [Acidobacteriota bacterium]